MTFSIGDRVRPTQGWRDGLLPTLPTGEVKKVAPFGKGQVVKVGSDSKWYVSGIFEREDGE